MPEHHDEPASSSNGTYSFVVVSNRLPVDYVTNPDGTDGWRESPGGLVTALKPIMKANGGAWVGWPGVPNHDCGTFEYDGVINVPVRLTDDDLEEYYEGFSNDTLWPLYHDVIAPPKYHRHWWERYREVNERFASIAMATASHGAIVWVQDYQLQLVPQILRKHRPDLVIGFFNHIPFPAYGIFAQLPWRRQIVEGILGADVVGFQRSADAGNFLRAVRRIFALDVKGHSIQVPDRRTSKSTSSGHGGPSTRKVVARHFPISIDAEAYENVARRPEIVERARQIREELGNPQTVLLGVDRLDYTKGIGHRIKAFGELLVSESIRPGDVTLVQVASPSRERVETYQQMRDEIERAVGRLNGDFSTLGHTAVHYLHHGYPREEMVAMYLAADVMLVTALRDGMNLVAKEYVASRFDNDGVLILSEFAGASDELRQALLVNPHDIECLKETILRAIDMPETERKRRMRALRRRVREYDVVRWSATFIDVLKETAALMRTNDEALQTGDA